jgi:hypothetical protein
MKMINAVKFKNDKSFEKTKVKSNVVEVHEPFKIVVFEDETPVEPDYQKVKQVTPVLQDKVIPSGLAVVITNDYKKATSYFKDNNIEVKDSFEISKTFIVDIPDHVIYNDFYNLLIASGLFTSIVEDKIVEHKSDLTNYPYSAHWWLGNINSSAAWAQMGAASVVDVAVIEGDGCETTHPDLIGKFNQNWNCVANNNNVNPVSDNEKHGTPCAGIIAANCANNELVLSTGNDKVKVQFLKVGYNHTSSGTWSTSDSIMTLAVNKAMANPNCAAISMSFGSSSAFTSFRNALITAKATGRGGKGIPLFASSGNSGLSVFTQVPAAWPEVMAIGSSNSINTRSSFSNYGTNLFAAAPGSSVLTTDRTGGKGYSVNIDPSVDGVTYFNGTSAACPVMAGVAATMIAVNPSLTEYQVRTILAQTSRKLGGYVYTSGKSLELGYGIVDHALAVDAAISGAIPTPVTPNITMTMSAQGTAVQGSIIQINYTVNLTAAQTNSLTLRVSFYRSLDAMLTHLDTLIQTEVITIPASTTMYTASFNYTIPSNIVGNVHVIGFVDSNNIVSEPIEFDNTASVIINVVTTGPVPSNNGLDLGVEILQTRYSRGRLYVKYKFTNVGSVAITSYTFVRGFIGGTQQTKKVNNVNMQPGQSVTNETVWYPQPPSYPGTYRVTITEVNGVVDSVSTNNVSTIQVNQNVAP